MARFAFHETPVKFTEIFIVEPFAQSLESFTAAGFDQRHHEEIIKHPVFIGTPFSLELYQFIHVLILSLLSKPQPAFVELCQNEPEVAPFLGHDRSELSNQLLFITISLDQADAGACGFLLAIGMVGEDTRQRNAGKVDPPWIRW